jgi:hypothetical protein
MEAVGELLERLATGRLISPAASQAMIETLLGTITGQSRIPARLPAQVPVAHKTGTQYQRICDLGIIYVSDDRPVVMAACTKGGTKKRSEEFISVVARRVYDLLGPEGSASGNGNNGERWLTTTATQAGDGQPRGGKRRGGKRPQR